MPAAACVVPCPGLPRSTSATLRPRDAARHPTASPITPAPTISTSVDPCFVLTGRFDPSAAAPAGRGAHPARLRLVLDTDAREVLLAARLYLVCPALADATLCAALDGGVDVVQLC